MGDLSFLLLLVASLQLTSTTLATPSTRVAPRFTINLDQPPEQRWTEVMLKYAEIFKTTVAIVRSGMSSEVLDLLALVGSKVGNAFPYPYNRELVGVANATGTSIADVVLLNVLYEITAYDKGEGRGYKACTSIVAESRNGTIIHGRNLDYSLGALLPNLTITVDFRKGEKTAYTGTTFAGYIGILTGQKPHAFTVSINERDEGKLWMNGLEALVNGMRAVASVRVRDALANEEFNYEKALAFLSDKPLIASCYIVVGGAKPSEGAVITRDRSDAADIMRIHSQNGTWYVLETNYDHWTTPPPEDDRRDPGIKYMDEMGRDNVTEAGLFDVLSTAPVLNTQTTYTVVMSAAHPELYNSWIRNFPDY